MKTVHFMSWCDGGAYVFFKTWYTLEAAADKFGIQETQLMEWVEEGLVRSESEGGTVTHVNIDDVRIEVEAMVKRG